jgi:uncharacterized protein YndB with AHSA1/START domain
MTDVIHIQSFVSAEPAAIWPVMMERADVVLDALPGRAWPEARKLDPPRRLVCQWPHLPGPTVVELTLTALEVGTRLDLKHGGLSEGPEWEPLVQGHFAGWLHALATLGLLVETGTDPRPSRPELAGRERYFISGEIPAPAEAVWRALTDSEVMVRWAGGLFDGAPLIDEVEDRFARWALPQGELVVILRRTPRGTHCALAEYGVRDRSASARWPAMFEKLARFLA